MAGKLMAADLFCGAGGASTGLLRAAKSLGVDVELLAVNHWPTAIDTHSLNHPGVKHLCATLEHVRPIEAVPGGRLNILLAGPECTHHSTARGGKPINDQSRATAWCVVKWAQELYIDSILIENVPEFRTWGPIGASGRPLERRKGETYQAWLQALRSLDYTILERELCAADYGDPTTRKRLFIIAVRGRNKSKVAFPSPTHAKKPYTTANGRLKPWRAAREIIDWSLEGTSIFDRKHPLKPNTMRRILAGLERFGGPQLEPFLVVLRQHMGGLSIDGPVPALTAGGQHVGLAQPVLLHTTHGGRARSIDQPLPTVTGANRGELALAAFALSQQSGGAPRSTNDPLSTIAAGGAISLVQPFIVPQFSEAQPKSTEDPLGTLTTTSRGVGVVEPFIFANRTNNAPKGVDEPVPALCTGNHIAVVQPFVLQQQSNGAPRSIEDPLPTITGGGKQAFIQSYYGTLNLSSTEEPLPTVTAKPRFAVVEPFVVDAGHGMRHSKEKRTKSLDEPLGVVTGSNRFYLAQPVVEIDGTQYKLDIRFRMLQPHELAGAMSFPSTYVFTGSKEAKVKQIGNSWPGETAMALCRELVKPFAKQQPKSRRRVA